MTYPRSRSSCSSYDTATTGFTSLLISSRTTTPASSISSYGSWGKSSISPERRPSVKYLFTPTQAFPTVLETDHELGPGSPTFQTLPRRYKSTRPARPSRPFPSVDLCPAGGDNKAPPLEQFCFPTTPVHGTPASPSAPRVVRRTASAIFTAPTADKPDDNKGLLRRALHNSVSHVRNVSANSIERLRSLSRKTACRRPTSYASSFSATEEVMLPSKLEPAAPTPAPTPASTIRHSSRVSRVILQVPRSEPLLPAVLKAADEVKLEDIKLTLALAELKLIVTPGEQKAAPAVHKTIKSSKRATCAFDAFYREPARPDSQLLPADLDVTRGHKRCESTPPDLGPRILGPIVSCSRRASRPVWAYI